MKLIGIMSLQEDRGAVRELLRDRGVSIYSETEIFGHSTETIARFGWFSTPHESPAYGSLSFAIVPDEEAESLFTAIGEFQRQQDTEHPVRAFLVPVDKMI